LCKLVHLQKLYIEHNYLRNTLPSCFANLTSLEDLIFYNNHFQIPTSLEPFFNLSKLENIDVENSEIYAETQSLPHSLVPKFQLNSNSLVAEMVALFPCSSTIKYQRALREDPSNSSPKDFKTSISPTTSSMIHGHIPIEIGTYLPSLNFVNMSSNALNGSLPSSSGDMSSNNQLCSEIPDHLAAACFSLQVLILSNHNLQGRILDGNNFTGGIPNVLFNNRVISQ
ncbi:hypothetical protein Ddye_012701, partial [Dipteronia dyeriana]